MSLASTLRSLRGRRLRDEVGHEHVLELLPPAGEAELARLTAVARPCLRSELAEPFPRPA
jgi:hypothetical protein